MGTQFRINVQILFIVACFTKIACLLVSFAFGELWVTGLGIPIAIMLTYIFVGLKYRDRDVSDEKFADSCYYLGFIFTIASIIVSLLDLPSIQNDMMMIATRFGVAMGSTILGLAVRVILVSFRPNMEDAVRNSEDSVIDATRKLTEEFVSSYEALKHFRDEVMNATIESVKTVRSSFEEVARQNAELMAAHFEETAERNNKAFLEIIQEVKTASMGLKLIVDKYAQRSGVTLEKLDQKVDTFTTDLVGRLERVAFPDDLFSQKLAGPIGELNGSTKEVNAGIRSVSRDVGGAAKAVEISISKINLQSERISAVLDVASEISREQSRLLTLINTSHELALKQSQHHDQAAAKLSERQQVVNERLDVQITNLNVMSKSANSMTESVGRLVEHISQGQQSSGVMTKAVEQLYQDQQVLISTLRDSVSTLPGLLKGSMAQTEALTAQMREAFEGNQAETQRIAETLMTNERNVASALDKAHFISNTSEALAGKVDALISNTEGLSHKLDLVTKQQAQPSHSFPVHPVIAETTAT